MPRPVSIQRSPTMKALTILVMVFLLFLSALASEEAGKPVSGRFFNMPVSAVLKVHGRLSGTPVAVSAELLSKKPGLTFTLNKLPKDEALRVIERELAMQAGVEIVRAPDGTLFARRIELRK